MAKKRRLRKTGQWEKLLAKRNPQPVPVSPIVVEAIKEEPVIAEPITAEQVVEVEPVVKKRTAKKKTNDKKKEEKIKTIAAPAEQEAVDYGLVEIEKSKPKRSWFKKVTSDED